MNLPERAAFVIIPARNEQLTVGSVALAAAKAETISGVVVVDDGSDDQTYKAALDVRTSFPPNKQYEVVAHAQNMGKSGAINTGVEVAKKLGGTSLHSLAFIDDDLSPLSSRQTPANKKLGAILVDRLLQRSPATQEPEMQFESALAAHIDTITTPVLKEQVVMNIGMLRRTDMIDALRLALDWGALGGNRAVSLRLWEAMIEDYQAQGLELRGWELEAALNTYCRIKCDEAGVKLNRSIGKFVMPDVVNIGSRVKAGGFLRGLSRMAAIQSRALSGFVKFSALRA